MGGGAFVGIEPVLVKAVDFCRNSASAAIPSLEPRISGMAMSLDAALSIFRCCVYLGHSLKMWVLVSRVSSSHGHVFGSGERGRKELRNSPVYECPVRHCVMRPKISRLSLRFLKWGVGLSEGLILFEIAYLPTLGELLHSICQSLRVDDLARLLA